jgi:hypothetical protein
MFKINNKAIVELDQFVDIDSLMAMKPYMDYAVVKSSKSAGPTRYLNSQLLKATYPGVSDVITHSYPYDFIQDLKDNDQYASWLSYTEDIVCGQRSVQIVSPEDWYKKHLSKHTTATDNKQYWTAFIMWLEAQDIFAEYGRIVVFLNEPGGTTPIHYDSLDRTRLEEFVWISLDSRKQMFVYDPETEEKHYVKTCIGTFDTSNYHGADASNFPSWSLRVDGVFSDKFLSKTGLTQHFRPN